MYSETSMYSKGRRGDLRRNEARYWGRAQGVRDRLLLLIGAVSLLAVVPSLWIWLLYSGRFGAEVIYGGGIGLCVLAAGIGFAMIRILDGAG
jgi:hypothetical protein